jgi:hypothetical protein
MSGNKIQNLIAEVSNHPEGFHGLMDRLSYVTLLQLLECPYSEVAANLRGAFLKAGLTDDDYNRVSLAELVVLALRSSDYWADLGVRWLEKGFPLRQGIVDAIDAMVTSKTVSQSVRHRAYRLARRWERAKGAGRT